MKALWSLAILGSIAGGLVAIATLATASSAPQEAAGMAIALAAAVIPYCLARACQFVATDQALQELRASRELLAALVNQSRSTPAPRPRDADQSDTATA